MKKIVFILFLLLSQVFCFGQTYNDIVSDREIASFLIWEVNSTEGYPEEPWLSSKRRISHTILKWDSLNFICSDTLSKIEKNLLYLFKEENKLDTIFDAEYLLKQFNSCKDVTWKIEVPNTIMTSRRVRKRPNRYYYSVPLFSKDRKYVIVKRVYLCGSLCAYGGYFIYKKVDKSSWKLVKIVNMWVS